MRRSLVNTQWHVCRLLLIGFAAFQLCGCAKEGMPQGGPPDTTPPRVVSTVPAAGETHVSRVAEIRLEFSEPVERLKLLPNLYIAPLLHGDAKVKWKGRRVRLSWRDSLKANVTYRVTIGGKLPDQHNNPMGDAFTFAFSTGAQIDSGRVAGQVFTGRSGTAGLEVFVYPIDSSTNLELPEPDFVTQTGEEGRFDLPYLPPSLVRIIAVGDQNHNLKPDPGEVVAIPIADVDLRGGASDTTLALFTHVYDTSAFTISGCSQGDDGSILVGLTHPVDTASFDFASLIVTDSVSGETLAVTPLRPAPPRYTIMPVIGEAFVPGNTYRVAVSPPPADRRGLRDKAGHTVTSGDCWLRYRVVTDTIGPRVTRTVFPTEKNAVSPRAPIIITFNEPVDTAATGRALQWFDSLGQAIAGTLSWPDLRSLRLSPAAAWPESTVILVSLDSAIVKDRAGNSPPSQTLTWTFTPLTRSQMGYVSCVVRVRDSSWRAARCHLEFHATGSEAVVERQAAVSEQFEQALPSGLWILSAWLDLNNDGRYFPGTVEPFQFAEPRVVLADTLAIRARFTLDGITVRF